MKHRMIDLLRSVPDGSRLRLAKASEVIEKPKPANITKVMCSEFCALKSCPVAGSGVTPADCAGCYTREIIEGELSSETGRTYPIRGGIPRILSDKTDRFIKKNQATFSLEWKYFRFGERNWGQDIEFRKGLFLKGMGQEPGPLRGKTIFDAGCGSGLLSINMAESYGMEVIGVDLATGIEQAYQHNTNPHVHFAQGSVLEPPVRPGAVDILYCAGVLVALPDSLTGFKALAPCVKPGGRYFIWLYHPLEYHRATGDYHRKVFYDWLRTRITCRLPIRVQEALYLGLLPPYFLRRVVLRTFGIKTDDRNWREKMQGFIDYLSPLYMNRHTPEEAAGWYRDLGFTNVEVAYREQYGFGIRGDKPE